MHSGSAFAPWALANNPRQHALHFARQLNCVQKSTPNSTNFGESNTSPDAAFAKESNNKVSTTKSVSIKPLLSSSSFSSDKTMSKNKPPSDQSVNSAGGESSSSQSSSIPPFTSKSFTTRHLNDGELLNCLRSKSLSEILSAQRFVRPGAHLTGFGPALDGIVLSPLNGNSKLEHSSFSLPLLLGFSSLDVRPEDARLVLTGRDTMLKNLVRSLYTYHLQVLIKIDFF